MKPAGTDPPFACIGFVQDEDDFKSFQPICWFAAFDPESRLFLIEIIKRVLALVQARPEDQLENEEEETTIITSRTEKK